MKAAVVHFVASLVQDPCVSLGALGRTGYRDDAGVTGW